MILVLVSLFSFVHPFHVSVSDVKYKEDKKAIQISTRIFLDDLELALRSFSGEETLDIMDESKWNFIDSALESYLIKNFSLKDEKNKALKVNYVGAEIEDDVMWCYLEIEKVKKLRAVTVTNKILHEVWADQENLVHFRAFDGVKSARLFKGEESKKFTWK